MYFYIMSGYQGPSPPSGKAHRYRLFLFKQPQGATTPAKDTPRQSFNLNDAMNSLEGNWGNPVAQFQFKTENRLLWKLPNQYGELHYEKL